MRELSAAVAEEGDAKRRERVLHGAVGTRVDDGNPALFSPDVENELSCERREFIDKENRRTVSTNGRSALERFVHQTVFGGDLKEQLVDPIRDGPGKAQHVREDPERKAHAFGDEVAVLDDVERRTRERRPGACERGDRLLVVHGKVRRLEKTRRGDPGPEAVRADSSGKPSNLARVAERFCAGERTQVFVVFSRDLPGERFGVFKEIGHNVRRFDIRKPRGLREPQGRRHAFGEAVPIKRRIFGPTF